MVPGWRKYEWKCFEMEKLLWHTAPYGSTLTGLHYWPDIPIVHSLDISWGEAINRLKEKLRYSLEASVFQKLVFVGNTLNLQFWFLVSHRVLFPCWILQHLPWSQHIPSETWYYNSAKPSCYSSYWDLQVIQAESKTTLCNYAKWGIREDPAEPLYLVDMVSLL